MHYLVYSDELGYCRVIAAHFNFRQPLESEEDALGRLHSRAIPNVIEFLACSPDFIPNDLTFRDAWEKGDKETPVKINIEKAIKIHRLRLKKAADRKIEELDKDFQEAFKSHNLPAQVSIQASQRILREIHNMNLTHCKTANDVKNSIPSELKDVWQL